MGRVVLGYFTLVCGYGRDVEYHDSATAVELAGRARQFTDEVVIPTGREYPGPEPVPRSTVDDLREEARTPVSVCEVFAANTTRKAIDLAIRCTGGSGLSEYLPLSDVCKSVRAFRVVDGADEVQKRVLAGDASDEANLNPEELESIPTY
ncbi:hypothetical protein BRC93_02865 [Halobacteriales archaeon QS_5_70_15]|nr:MAG: hypothetical protein BRC93_02865 [Halobacteriales archaeon QS_5_70_15]